MRIKGLHWPLGGRQVLKAVVGASVVTLLSGCATTWSHYGAFSAHNSAGEERQFRVSWKSADYPDWWIQADEATPIVLETQCSERIWELRDEVGGDCPGTGIRACGKPGTDKTRQGQVLTVAQTCMVMNDARRDVTNITELSGEIHLSVNCTPVSTGHKAGKKTVNTDYLRASVVPYTIQVRKVPLHSLSNRPPKFDEKACLEE